GIDHSTVCTVLLLASAHLALRSVFLQKILGLSPIHQLTFVLEKQYSGVQLKLVFWVYYNAQASLQHMGEFIKANVA
ncbi:hypothetical protein JG688_00002767, partial [Phytophthora aleatoria]